MSSPKERDDPFVHNLVRSFIYASKSHVDCTINKNVMTIHFIPNLSYN